MTDFESNAQKVVDLALAILKRWGNNPHDGAMLTQVKTEFGLVYMYTSVIQIANCDGPCSNIYGHYHSGIDSFAVSSVTGDLVKTERALMVLALYLATRDFNENKRSQSIGTIRRVAKALMQSDVADRLKSMSEAIAPSKS